MRAGEPYDWRCVTVKGNGYINGIVYAPAAAKGVAYIHTDMGGAYRLDPATGRWNVLTDWAQWTDPAARFMGSQTMATDPTDANRVYLVMGTYQSPAAFLRSTDQGRSWQRTDMPAVQVDGNGWGRSVGQRLAVDPNSPNVLYYGAQYYGDGASGLWKSTDRGATWSRQSQFTALGDRWNGRYAAANGVGLSSVAIDRSSGSAGKPSQTLYVAVATAADSPDKIYRTTDGGASWTPIPNQPKTPFTPNRIVLAPDGSALYIAYANAAGPYGANTGALYKVTKPSTAEATWTQVTPAPGAYCGVALDPTDPSTVYAALFDKYPDPVYRSTDGGATWTSLDVPNHLDHSPAPYSGSMGKGASPHWVTDLQIDPNDRNVAMFVTGYGLFRTTDLTAANPKWVFFNEGFEQSAVLELASPANGPVNLFSAIGDRDGYRHDDFSVSPALGRFGQNQPDELTPDPNDTMAKGTSDDIDVAWDDANVLVRTVRHAPWVQYSTDNGKTWAWFGSKNSAGHGDGVNAIALSADGNHAVYEPGGNGRARYAAREGKAWGEWMNPASNAPADGAKVVADLVSGSETLFAYAGTTVSRSTDGGANWTVMSTTAPDGATWIRAVPAHAGHLVVSCGEKGLWRTTDGGASWSQLGGGTVTVANQVGVGAPPPGKAYPAIYVGGTANGETGFFRSDDEGKTWVTISDRDHQFGYVTVIQGDARVYGRLYVGANGRGILCGDKRPK